MAPAACKPSTISQVHQPTTIVSVLLHTSSTYYSMKPICTCVNGTSDITVGAMPGDRVYAEQSALCAAHASALQLCAEHRQVSTAAKCSIGCAVCNTISSLCLMISLAFGVCPGACSTACSLWMWSCGCAQDVHLQDPCVTAESDSDILMEIPVPFHIEASDVHVDIGTHKLQVCVRNTLSFSRTYWAPRYTIRFERLIRYCA